RSATATGRMPLGPGPRRGAAGLGRPGCSTKRSPPAWGGPPAARAGRTAHGRATPVPPAAVLQPAPEGPATRGLPSRSQPTAPPARPPPRPPPPPPPPPGAGGGGRRARGGGPPGGPRGGVPLPPHSRRDAAGPGGERPDRLCAAQRPGAALRGAAGRRPRPPRAPWASPPDGARGAEAQRPPAL